MGSLTVLLFCQTLISSLQEETARRTFERTYYAYYHGVSRLVRLGSDTASRVNFFRVAPSLFRRNLGFDKCQSIVVGFWTPQQPPSQVYKYNCASFGMPVKVTPMCVPSASTVCYTFFCGAFGRPHVCACSVRQSYTNSYRKHCYCSNCLVTITGGLLFVSLYLHFI